VRLRTNVEIQKSPYKHTTKQADVKITILAPESRKRSASTGLDRTNWAYKKQKPRFLPQLGDEHGFPYI
jgi:hypothetical protein